jgi:hypothetical protein
MDRSSSDGGCSGDLPTGPPPRVDTGDSNVKHGTACESRARSRIKSRGSGSKTRTVRTPRRPAAESLLSMRRSPDVVSPRRRSNSQITCLFCKEIKPASDEHLFPEPLGHLQVLRCVCRDCNSILGHTVDIAADRDAVLTAARRQVGLGIRHAAVQRVEAATDVAGRTLASAFSRETSRPTVATRMVGTELVSAWSACDEIYWTGSGVSIAGRGHRSTRPPPSALSTSARRSSSTCPLRLRCAERSTD